MKKKVKEKKNTFQKMYINGKIGNYISRKDNQVYEIRTLSDLIDCFESDSTVLEFILHNKIEIDFE